MKLPNGDRAVIEQAKLVDYLLNPDHERGGSKAKLLIECGYSSDNWQQLDTDIRAYHLTAEVTLTKETPYGMRYTVIGPLVTPAGRQLSIRTIWQIDKGTDFPRLITLIPN